jgi:hypothetical protein
VANLIRDLFPAQHCALDLSLSVCQSLDLFRSSMHPQAPDSGDT